MRRDLEKMGEAEYDVLFIGGGITGACAAYDAAMRGLRVALVEKKDFGWSTSAATSKLIHGGLRYLKNLEFGLVRESLRERRTLEKIAPHLVLPMPFLVPTYWGTSNNLPMLTAGMVLYDLFSFDKGWLEDEERALPHFRMFSKKQVLREEPGTDPNGLTGGALYYDCLMHNPERLTLEFVLGAANYGADVANYAEVVKLLLDKKAVTGAQVRDTLTGREYTLKAKLVVNVAGPWADFVSGMALGEQGQKHLIRSQGIHLIFHKAVEKYALVLRTPSKRHFFLVPWRGKTLAGTTDEKYLGSPDEFEVTTRAAQAFLDEINAVYPSVKLGLDDVTWSYGGLRPIVEEETEVEVEVYDASRKYEVYDHAEGDGLQGFVTVVGGKYTTSRNLAEQLVDLAQRKLRRTKTPSMTAFTPLPGGGFRKWRDFLQAGRKKYGEVAEPVLERLSLDYGTRRRLLIEKMSQKALATIVDKRHPIPAATVSLAVEQEMAMTLEDVLWRRTGLGNTGELTAAAVERTAKLAAKSLKWKKAETNRQIELALDKLARHNMVERDD